MSNAFAFVLRDTDTLVREDRPVPEPRRGEVVVALGATSVNFHDVIRVRGGYPDLPLPIVPFSDGCGLVVSVGEDVSRLKIGDRVMPNFFRNWMAGPVSAENRSVVYGDQIDGTLQSHLRTEASALVLAPEHLDDAEAATLGCAGLTAWRSVIALGNAQPNDVVVIEGTGGVALFALTFAKLAGARVILTSSSDEKLERARALGADDCINYRATPDWGKEVKRLTNGEGASHIVDIGGPETLPHAIQACRIGGRISIIGARSGLDANPIFPVRVVMKGNITLSGVSVGSRLDFETMVAAIAQHKIRPVIGGTFLASQVMDAIAQMEAQTHFGKIAINLQT